MCEGGGRVREGRGRGREFRRKCVEGGRAGFWFPRQPWTATGNLRASKRESVNVQSPTPFLSHAPSTAPDDKAASPIACSDRWSHPPYDCHSLWALSVHDAPPEHIPSQPDGKTASEDCGNTPSIRALPEYHDPWQGPNVLQRSRLVARLWLGQR